MAAEVLTAFDRVVGICPYVNIFIGLAGAEIDVLACTVVVIAITSIVVTSLRCYITGVKSDSTAPVGASRASDPENGIIALRSGSK